MLLRATENISYHASVMSPTPEPTPFDFITIVSGLPRSGTSLMMQMLAAGGVPPLTDELRPSDESNPRGYFEFEAVKRLRSDQSWLDQARGRAVKIIHLLLRELPVDGRFEYRVLLMLRPIEEVLASQHAMLVRQGKQPASASLAGVYASQLVQAQEWMRAHPCFSFLTFEHHSVIQQPEASAAAITEFLQRDLDVKAMAAAVDPSLWRERQK
jgi:hypothetical protein